MSSIIQAMKNKVAYKINNLVSDPEAEKFAKEAEQRRKEEEKKKESEKEEAERQKRSNMEFTKQVKKVAMKEPGIDKIERIYSKKIEGKDEEEEWIDISFRPYPDGRKEPIFSTEKKLFDIFFGSKYHDDKELNDFIKKLYDDYDKRQKQEVERITKANFSTKRLATITWKTFWDIFGKVILILLGILAASLAVNLNLYKSWLYRILYAIFSYKYWFVVIPYVYLYRWAWLGKKPKFYSLLPLVPLRLEGNLLPKLYSWMSYKPDDEIDSQREWLTWKKEQE
jgi:hypothetical protein